MEVRRVIALLRSVRSPAAPALGEWDLTEVAVHLSQAWLLVTGLAARDLLGVDTVVPALDGVTGPGLVQDMWDLAGVTREGVRSDAERNLWVLADRIEHRAEDFFAAPMSGSACELRPWFVEGVRVTLPTLACHLLSETIVHGRDIARADGRRWPIEPSHAAMAWEGFLVPALQALDPRAMVDQAAARGLRATYELQIRGGGRYVFVFDGGELTLHTPSARRVVDCRLSADPAALLLVSCGRMNQWHAICRGQLTAWGRKPWLAPRLRTMMRNP